MMNHPQKGIFTPNRTEPLTGRNANIQPTMFKRKQIFERTQTQRFETPFSGYSFTGSSISDMSSLARSQVSQFSQENVIRLIKQELQKNGINSTNEGSEQNLKYKNELNILRIEIRSIKESFHELNKSFKKKLQQQNDTISELRKQINTQAKDNSLSREDMSNQLVDKIKEVEQDIAIKMRLIFGKMQEDLRKELTNYANREFVPTSFLDDLDKQLNEIDDRIANIENQYEANKNTGNKQQMTTSKIDKDSSVILSSGSQLKLKQFQRDLINLKKQIDENAQKIKEIDQSIVSKNEDFIKELKETKEFINQFSHGLKEIQKDHTNSIQVLQTKIEADRKKIFERLQSEFDAITKRMDQQFAMKSLNNGIESNINMFKKQKAAVITENNELFNQSNKFQDTRDESKISAFDSSSGISQNNDTGSLNKVIQNDAISPFTTENLPNGVNGNESSLNTKDSPKRTKKITITYGAPQSTEAQPPIVEVGIQTDQNQTNQIKQQFKNLYKVDKDGYLMDSANKYILSTSNNLIFVSEKQIQAIEKGNLVKIERWSEPLTTIN